MRLFNIPILVGVGFAAGSARSSSRAAIKSSDSRTPIEEAKIAAGIEQQSVASASREKPRGR
jgi:hypothetical protein